MISTAFSSLATHNIDQKILGARYNEKDMFHKLLVAWRGFPLGDATWEAYSVMAVNVPEMVT
jgi:hypothetical protein